jgi:hypothetical protein
VTRRLLSSPSLESREQVCLDLLKQKQNSPVAVARLSRLGGRRFQALFGRGGGSIGPSTVTVENSGSLTYEPDPHV